LGGGAGKIRESVIRDFKMNLDGLATDFAVLDVVLDAVFRQVQEHRDLFATIGALESLLVLEFQV